MISNELRVKFLQEIVTDSVNDSKKSYAEYAEKYGSTRDAIRKYYRRFYEQYLKEGLWFTGYPIEPEFRSVCYQYGESLSSAGISDSKDPKQLKINELKYEEDEIWKENIEAKTAYLEFKSDKKIKTLEEAIEAHQVDTTKYQVKSWECTNWGVTSFQDGIPTYKINYRVKLNLTQKEDTIEDVLELVSETLKDYTPKPIQRLIGNGKVGVAHVGDFHIGAEVQDLVRTLPYNLEILVDYLNKAVEEINSQNFSEVHVNMLGDFFESISGLNHPDSWKSMGKGMYGAEVIKTAHKILSDNFLNKINNLVQINIIGGNHDRLSSDKKTEAGSEGAKILAYLFELSMPDVKIDFNFAGLIKDIDGIRYMLFHGDNSITKQDATKTILDYGAGDNYTCIVNAHRHTREVKKTIKTSVTTYKNSTIVSLDELKYRVFTIASFFTGNLFSENLGFASTAGFLLTWNNGRNRPNTLDICLS